MKNILLIGLGNIGKIHYRNLSRLNNINIFVFDTNSEVMSDFVNKKIQKELKFEDIVNNNSIDAAIIASPTSAHTELSIALSKKLIPHLIEKPICLNKQEYSEIFNVAKKNDVFVMCGFTERFHKSIVVLKSKIRKQRILNFSSIRHSLPPSQTRQLDDVKFDILIHDLDLFQFLTSSTNFKNVIISENKNFSNANYIFDDVSATFTANRVSHKKRREINIITDKFEYHVDLIQNKLIKYEYKLSKSTVDLDIPFIKTDEEIEYIDPTESIFNEQKYFLNNLKFGFNQALFESYNFSHYALFNAK